MEALIDQRNRRHKKADYVFLDIHGKPLTTDHMREVIWKPALKKAGIEYRPMMQTRHTFATISLSEGENIGWVQHMLGHSSLQMIFTKYYAWMPKETRNDGSVMMSAYESIQGEKEVIIERSKIIDFKKESPKSSPNQRYRFDRSGRSIMGITTKIALSVVRNNPGNYNRLDDRTRLYPTMDELPPPR